MTLDEAIKEFTDWAKDNRKEQNFWAAERDENDETNPLSYADCEGLARDAEARAEYHEQLAKWLTQLKEAKRLLKLAVEDISTMPCNNDTHRPDSCYICVKHGNCSYADSFKWCKADIALKLIGEDENDNSD